MIFNALAVLFAALPTYAIRFNVGLIPLNLLEVLSAIFLILFIYWIYSKKLTLEFKELIQKDSKVFKIWLGLFFIAGTASMFVNWSNRSIGMFAVLFLIPLLIYYPAKFILRDPISKARFIKWIFIVLAVFSLYGILQYFTLIGLPEQWWGNSVEPKRALSFFEYPNAFALFLAPLLAYLLPFVFAKLSLNIFYKICYGISIFALLLTLSRGAWVGFIAALGVYAAIAAGKKARITIIVSLVVMAGVVASFPNLKYRVILPFLGEKSSVSRLSLWDTAGKMVKDSPITGKGLYGYPTNFNNYNTDPNLTALNFPHNIFLNFWVETGLLGLISFIAISIFAFFRAWKYKGLGNIGIILFLVALFTHGLIDAPYLKNDLALLYWLILASGI